MKKLNLKEVPKLKLNPIFKGLSSDLKDPKNFKKTEKKLQDILKTDHKHKTALAYSKCQECNIKREIRKQVMREIGFKNIQQYMEWRKVMTIIKNKSNFQVQ